MNKFLACVVMGVVVAANAMAQDRSKTADGLPPVQPPPAMDDPGSTPAAKAAPAPTAAVPASKTVPLADSTAEAHAAADEAKRRAATPLPTLPPEPEKKFNSPGLPPDVQKAAEATELPVVTVRQEGNQTIEEYRKHGKLFAQYIISKDSGSTKWYVDPAYKGPMPADPAAGVSGHIAPVEYKIFGW